MSGKLPLTQQECDQNRKRRKPGYRQIYNKSKRDQRNKNKTDNWKNKILDF